MSIFFHAEKIYFCAGKMYFYAEKKYFHALVILFPTMVILFPKVGILITKGGRKIGTDIGSQINLCLQISAHKDLRSSATSAWQNFSVWKTSHAKAQRDAERYVLLFLCQNYFTQTSQTDAEFYVLLFLCQKSCTQKAQKYTEFCFACSAKVCAVCVRQFHSARH